MKQAEKTRCSWAPSSNQLMVKYHDTEWGVPTRDSQQLFELLCLEGAQAGLSWNTILQRREGYRKAFSDFDAQIISGYEDSDIDRLMQDATIVRNRLKIKSVIANAQAYLDISNFSEYIWSFTAKSSLTTQDQRKAIKIAEQMSRDLKDRGFSFVGPTIMFAYMQSAGMIYDHEPGCYLYM